MNLAFGPAAGSFVRLGDRLVMIGATHGYPVSDMAWSPLRAPDAC
jgi:hypothetical protein